MYLLTLLFSMITIILHRCSYCKNQLKNVLKCNLNYIFSNAKICSVSYLYIMSIIIFGLFVLQTDGSYLPKEITLSSGKL